MNCNLLVLLAISSISTIALADGFVCKTDREDLDIRVSNPRPVAKAFPSAAMKISSNPIAYARKRDTALFTNIQSSISASSIFYLANVATHSSPNNRPDGVFSGIRLNLIDQIMVEVFFDNQHIMQYGEYVPGTLTIAKRDGHRTLRRLDCFRYLKNE